MGPAKDKRLHNTSALVICSALPSDKTKAHHKLPSQPPKMFPDGTTACLGSARPPIQFYTRKKKLRGQERKRLRKQEKKK
jgi:hypothetical protein